MNSVRLKLFSMNARARVCKITRESSERLSSRPSSSTFFPGGFRSFFARAMSSTAPESMANACCRCKTYGLDEPESSSGAWAPPSAGGLAFLGLMETAMVVPKREWRVFACRAKLRLRWSSTASRLDRFFEFC